MARRAWTDEEVDQILGRLLRAGVIVASAVVLAGGLAYLVSQGTTVHDYRVFRGEPPILRSPAGVVRDALGLDSRGIMQLGILVLLATPVARVAFSVLAFLRQRDPIYVLVTVLVLAILLYSLTRGL
jgi:uncharacterized membrane protein